MRIRLGLVGFGVIGEGVVALLEHHAEILRLRSGVELVLERIADIDTERIRRVTVDRAKLTRDYREILTDPAIDIVVELVGGITVARDVVRGALEQGKHVVTANKALLYHHKDELFALATARQRELRFEASVAGGIPIVKVLTESLAGDRVRAMYGIVNGTTNFILTRMIEEHWSFADALARAQALGFAEADPSLDVNGGDATHKLDILATVAFNARVDRERIFTLGIDDLSLTDVLFAKELGYVVKLLAVAKQADHHMMLRVGPTLIPERCSLASVKNEFNAVMLQSDFLGDSLHVGRGAGARPTATAVVSDLSELAISIAGKREFNPHRYAPFNEFATSSHLDAESRFYLRLGTIERPGILAEITTILGHHGISISAIIQKETPSDTPDQTIPIVILTRRAREGAIRDAAAKIDQLAVTRQQTVILPVEDLEL
ncbi:MAG: homoserine dehydrogenase [Polyangiaceae bacterium]|nr:homoserine dehydrogenase [Polyangiaceae bacterium]